MDHPPPERKPNRQSSSHQSLLHLTSPIPIPAVQRRQCLQLLAEMLMSILQQERREQTDE
jgi:hypothetical protein